MRHAVAPHVLDDAWRQLVEHLGLLRPHAVVALQQRVRALLVKFVLVQEASVTLQFSLLCANLGFTRILAQHTYTPDASTFCYIMAQTST